MRRLCLEIFCFRTSRKYGARNSNCSTSEVPGADAAIAMEEAFYQFIEANPVSGTIEADNTYVKSN